jgi:hypothetical protein
MNAKSIAIGIVLGMVGAYILALVSAKAGPLPGLKA